MSLRETLLKRNPIGRELSVTLSGDRWYPPVRYRGGVVSAFVAAPALRYPLLIYRPPAGGAWLSSPTGQTNAVTPVPSNVAFGLVDPDAPFWGALTSQGTGVTVVSWWRGFGPQGGFELADTDAPGSHGLNAAREAEPLWVDDSRWAYIGGLGQAAPLQFSIRVQETLAGREAQ